MCFSLGGGRRREEGYAHEPRGAGTGDFSRGSGESGESWKVFAAKCAGTSARAAGGDLCSWEASL